MKKATLSILLFCVSFFSQAQTAFTQPTDATDCTNMLFKALLEKDGNVLSNVLAQDFSIISFQGREINRDILIGSVAKGYLSVESGMLSGIRSRNFSDVTIVTGLWNVRAKIENNTLQGEMAFMSVCIRAGGVWKVSAMQLTPVQ